MLCSNGFGSEELSDGLGFVVPVNLELVKADREPAGVLGRLDTEGFDGAAVVAMLCKVCILGVAFLVGVGSNLGVDANGGTVIKVNEDAMGGEVVEEQCFVAAAHKGLDEVGFHGVAVLLLGLGDGAEIGHLALENGNEVRRRRSGSHVGNVGKVRLLCVATHSLLGLKKPSIFVASGGYTPRKN